MALEPSINLGDIKADDLTLLEFRDSLQILLDELFEKGHEEPNSNLVIATKSGIQNILSSTETKVLYNLIETGDSGEFNVELGRFQPTIEGDYVVTASVELPNITTTSYIYLVIKKNNVEVWKGAETSKMANVTGIVTIEEGDFVEIFLHHNDASAQDTTQQKSRIKFAGYKLP